MGTACVCACGFCIPNTLDVLARRGAVAFQEDRVVVGLVGNWMGNEWV